MDFIGYKVAAGETLAIVATENEDGQLLRRPHITNIALGPNPKPGRHTVFAEGNGAKAVVGTLEMGRCEQFTVDLPVNVRFSHSGKSDVYLSGYLTMSEEAVGMMEDDYEDDEDDEDEEAYEDDDLDADGSEAPQAVPLQQLMPSRVSIIFQTQALMSALALHLSFRMLVQHPP